MLIMLILLVQGASLSGSLALPASFDDIIVISWEIVSARL